MRYIVKFNEPICLSEHKKLCEENNVPKPYLYKDFHETAELRRILIEEQHNVCCYCQRHCRAYHTEHSYPEMGPNKDRSEALQLEYSNLFASCIDSFGNAPEDQFCDVSKGNQIIREFIKEELCKYFFRYNSMGEIIPNGQFHTWEEYEKAEILSKDEAEARHAIMVLNLNHHELKEARKTCIDTLLSVLKKKSNEEWRETIEDWINAKEYPDFIELRLQYIEKYMMA